MNKFIIKITQILFRLILINELAFENVFEFDDKSKMIGFIEN